jgi:hypothetical protein
MLKLSHSHHLSYPALKAALMLKSIVFFGVFVLFAADTSACCYDSGQDRSVSISVSVSSDEADDATPDISDESERAAESVDMQNDRDVSQDASDSGGSDIVNDSGGSDVVNDEASSPAVWAQRSKRRNRLVRKWRSEFARMDVFDIPSNQPLDVDDIKFQLERIQADLPESMRNEIAVLGSDLILLEEWMNDALDRRIPQKPITRKRQFALFRPSNLDAEGILNKLAMLESKREMLVYGNNALQAMGLFAK